MILDSYARGQASYMKRNGTKHFSYAQIAAAAAAIRQSADWSQAAPVDTGSGPGLGWKFYVWDAPLAFGSGVLHGAKQVFVDPVVHTGQFFWDVGAVAAGDPSYQPHNPYLKAYLNGQSGYWSTRFHVSLEAVASVTTLEGGFNLLGGVYQGMTAAGEAGAAGAAGEAGAAGGEAGSATGPAAGEPGAAGGEAGSANGPAAGEAGAAEGSGLKPPKQCFPAGTPVHTSVSLKAIDQVAVGDRVWTYDHRQLRWAEREVVEVYQLVHQGPMATVQVRGELLRATDGHPFWVVRGERLAERPLPVRIKAYEASRRQEGRWVLARDLRAGDEVLLRHREVAALESVRLDEVEERVYNFHVAELQNYAVGGWGVLVHNTNEGPTGTGPEPTSPAPGRLTPEQVRVVENARQIARGDCEQAAEVFRETLPGGTKQRFAGDRLLHEVYQHQGTVYDVTAKQYVRPGVWTPEELARAGLTDAVESGVFTPQQHQTFMQKVIQVFGGVQD